MHTRKKNLARSCCMAVCFLGTAMSVAHAETVYYTLDDVVLGDGARMTGTFSWTFDTNDFANGVGRFTSLDIPYTVHDQNDLDVAFDIGQSIEITLAGSVHDDGVDIALVLAQPLTPTTSSLMDLGASKYEIGGNGFHDGLFRSGRITPIRSTLRIDGGPRGSVTISWEPDSEGYVLQEAPVLSPAHWTNAPGGSTNPVVLPAAAPVKFYRVVWP